ncbi:FecR family protein [Chitinophaga lutea]
MLSKKDVQHLLDQYITGSIGDEERRELHRILRDPDYEQVVSGLLDDAFEERLAGSYHFPETAQRIKQGLLQRMAAPRRPIRRLIGWAAAAAVTGIALAGWWMLRQPEEPAKFARQQPATAMPAPGGNKATLVLSDGTIVPLDSAGNRQFTQGSAAIRQHNGSLQYAARGISAPTAYNTLRTPRGGLFQVTLGDGTKVWLNSASSLRYPTLFSGSERIVELTGQAYFEISPNASSPFRVKINGETEVQVLGTQFDVMAYPDEVSVKTTLVQGAVRVLHKSAGKVLQPGQQASTATTGDDIAISNVDVGKVTGWKNGLFIFNNMELPAILREVSRWYDVDIVYAAPASKNRYGGGISKKMALPDVLQFLQEGGGNHFKIEGNKIIVLP